MSIPSTTIHHLACFDAMQKATNLEYHCERKGRGEKVERKVEGRGGGDSEGRRGRRGKDRKGERERKDRVVSFFVSCRHSHITYGHPHTLSHLHTLFYDFSLWRYSLFERYQVLFSLYYLIDQTTNYLVIHHPSVPHLSHVLRSAESRQRDAGQFSIASHTSTTAQRSVMS